MEPEPQEPKDSPALVLIRFGVTFALLGGIFYLAGLGLMMVMP